MAQITWRNIGSTVSGSDANPLFSNAMTGIKDSFATLGDVLDKQREMQITRWDQGAERNTNEALMAGMEYTDPDAFANSMAEGKFRDMLAGYGDQVDHAAVRNFLDTRQGVLQERTLASQSYGDTQHNRDLQGVLMEALTAASQGDRSGIGDVVGQMRGPEAVAALETADKLFGNDFTRGINQQNATSNRISADASMLGARTSASRNAREQEIHDQAMRQMDYSMEVSGRLNDLVSRVQSDELTEVEDVTAELNAVEAQLRKENRLTPEQIQETMATLERAIATGTDLNFLEKGVMEQYYHAAFREAGGMDNPFVVSYLNADPAQNIVEEINNMFEYFSADDGVTRAFGITNEKDRAKLVSEAVTLATGGFTMTPRSDEFGKEPIDIKMPPEMIQLLGQGISGERSFLGWTWNSNASFTANAENFLNANPKMMEDAIKYTTYMKELERIGESALQAQGTPARIAAQTPASPKPGSGLSR